MPFALVAIPVPLRQLFTYEVPRDVNVHIGSQVLVPFHRRTVVGYVMQLNVVAEFALLKKILNVLNDEPVFSEKLVELIKWLADYYYVPIGEMCKAALPSNLSRGIVRKRKEIWPKETIIDDVFLSAPEVSLSASQQNAYEELKLSAPKFQTTLLHGITGSGKTEVYLRLFADLLDLGREAIFLVPEIGMTPQTVGRLTARFKDKIALYHSGLTDARRLYEWQRMKEGKARIVIGTRSAIFAPFKKLGAIIVDEEHDQSYKQDENPRYNGRDVAVMRAKLENIPCLLGSATPSIESFTNVKIKKYHYIHLPDRPTGAKLPDVEIIDMRDVQKGSLLSPRLISAMSETLRKKEQVMLFLNRRGFASFVLCRDCGEVFSCPNCNITLAYHKINKSLMCHYCDYGIDAPSSCKKCNSRNLEVLGTGTERIEDEISKFFPDAKVARFDRDTTSKAHARSGILSQMRSGKTDILIGTQMITKGHDFPLVTLVGVLDADLSLNFPDFRAPERTFQLLTQVAGRSGRGDKGGCVMIQTYSPSHYAVLSAAGHDFFRFYNEEVPHRKELSYPPFGRLVMIRVSGMKESAAEGYANEVANSIKKAVTILGPSQAPLYKIRNKYRWHILVKGKEVSELKKAVDMVLSMPKPAPRGVKVVIDVDPINML